MESTIFSTSYKEDLKKIAQGASSLSTNPSISEWLFILPTVWLKVITPLIRLMKAVLIHISYCLLYPTRSEDFAKRSPLHVHRSYRRCEYRSISIHIQDRLLCVREEYFPSMLGKFVSLTYCPAWIAIYKFVCAGLLVSRERAHNMSRRVFDCIVVLVHISKINWSSSSDLPTE